MGLKLTIYFYIGDIMKKYTLPLCGLAISLGVASSAIAAPVTGSQTISGTLTAPTCTISIPGDFKIPDIAIKTIDSFTYGTIIKSALSIGTVSIKNCENVSATALTPEGGDLVGPNSGRFTYENATKSLNNEPLLLQIQRTPNPNISDGRVINNFRMNNSNTVVLKDGDTLEANLLKGHPRAGDVLSTYIGDYHADVTFTFNYS